MWRLSRRSWLQATGLASLAGSLAAGDPHRRSSGSPGLIRQDAHQNHAMGTVGRVPTDVVQPHGLPAGVEFFGPAARGARRSSTARRRGRMGRCCASTELFAADREIEIAPGIFFPAWTYNGQVPGPTIRATEGDRVRITFRNLGIASAHDPLSRLAPTRDGRNAAGPGGAARRHVRLRVRRRAVRRPPISLPHRSAEAAHPQGTLRRVHRRPAQREPAAGRRDGDGDERVRHELRRGERGLRRQYGGQRATCRTRSASRSDGSCACI